jgi:predicted nucleic acid-binding protein
MRILDTNIFLRHLTQPATAQDVLWHEAASRLFERFLDDQEEMTTLEPVLHELFYMLCSKRHYGRSHEFAAFIVRPIIEAPNLHIARKPTVIRAIQMFERNEALDFTDCLLAVYAREEGHDLTTFDRELANEAGVSVFA